MDNEENKKYEISLLAREEGSVAEVVDFLKSEGAEIVVEPKPNMIKLAYPIQKEQSAYFSFIDFNVTADKIAIIDSNLKFNKNILRFLIVTPPPKKAAPKVFNRRGAAEAVKPVPQVEEDSSKGLSNEALEQKLEEILS